MIHRHLSPSLSPSPPYPMRAWGMRSLPLLDPLFCVFGLRVAHVKRKTLNAFFGHSRSFAHPKPYIQNDRRDEIYNPVPFVFWLLKTCHCRELPTQFSHFVLQCSSYQQWWVPWWIEKEATIGLQLPSLSKSSRLYLQFCRVAVVSSFPLCLQNKWIVMLFQNVQGHSASWEVLYF